MTSFRSTLLACVIALALTFLFWGPLWRGAGFIGGDLYPYFFPQKTFLADRLQSGEFPLWNNLTGFGYPVLGESQTGAAYPLHLVTYACLDVNTAYNAEHLIHYVLCFVATWLYARRVGLPFCSSLLMALVFTYGWFPPRACLEWAIVTGAWLPVAMWCVESFLQTRWWRYAIGLSLCLGTQLLAGHFHLDFITQMLVVSYGLFRIFLLTKTAPTIGMSSASVQPQVVTSSGPESSFADRSAPQSLLIVTVFAAVVAGFLLGAIQLIPAWELKTRSSRAVVGGEHDPSYGHLPPAYVSQLVAPFWWYSPHVMHGEDTLRTVTEFGAPWHWFGPQHDLEAAMQNARFAAIPAATNKVEAHLYCGLVPVGLAVWWLVIGLRSRCRMLSATSSQAASSRSEQPANAVIQKTAIQNKLALHESASETSVFLNKETLFWSVAGIVMLVYATGWLLPVARYLPGFNFFRGPGRYGIVTTWAIALLAARGLEALLTHRTVAGRRLILGLVFWSTCGDLWLVSRMVTNVVMVSSPAVSQREASPVRRLLLDLPYRPRLYCPGQNLGNLLGVSCLPVYLGIAPQEYGDPRFAGADWPKPLSDQSSIPPDPSFSEWLRQCGVTHVLSFHRLESSGWQAHLVWEGIDPLLHRAWGRRPDEPLFLYRLQSTATTDEEAVPGAILLGDSDLVRRYNSVKKAPAEGTTPSPESLQEKTIPAQRFANRIEFTVEMPRDGSLLLRELAYPGWVAEVDGRPHPSPLSPPYRLLELPVGSHRVVWTYRPASVRLGLAISLTTLFLLAAIGHVRYWHPLWIQRWLSRGSSSHTVSRSESV